VARPDVEIVLFDLGGVLIDPGGVGQMRTLSGIESDEELWHRWLTCPWVHSFESGTCTPQDFAAGVVADWELSISADQFLTEFRSWTADPLPGADEIVRHVQRVVPTGCLSNTNALQWDVFSKWPVLDEFDFRLLSFELGVAKPDPAIFEIVAERLPSPRGKVLFLDDNVLNTDAAMAAGFQAVHVRGVDEARRALVRVEILTT
jgi:HAD superfamily hydrolase (TIGR01509 family)